MASAGASGLDAAAMQTACDHLVGEHDFQHFCKINLANTQMHVRRVISATVRPAPAAPGSGGADLLVLDIQGSAFLWHQVRHDINHEVLLQLCGSSHGLDLVTATLVRVIRCPPPTTSYCTPMYQDLTWTQLHSAHMLSCTSAAP